jgi:hypothetical protein
MPGGRLRTFRLGNRAELLVEQLLAGFAFTTRVPLQEDVGIDFFCSLIEQEDQLLKAGPFFSVQAKSSNEPIVYKKPHELEWIRNQENPLLICVANRQALSMDCIQLGIYCAECLTVGGGSKKRIGLNSDLERTITYGRGSKTTKTVLRRFVSVSLSLA